MAEDPRRNAQLLQALKRVAPGTELRHGIDDIIRSHHGALIVIGEPSDLQFLFSGGLQLDHPFSAPFLYELAKMDGAIILNANATRIVSANVQLMPDPALAATATGTRHRTAERVAKQTGAIVISISQARDTVTLYVGEIGYQLDSIAELLAKTNQAVATLETFRSRLDQVASRLLALEFQGAVTLDDVLVVLQRVEMARRMGDEIELSVLELGREGRLLDMQVAELIADVPRERLNLELGDVLGYGGVNPLDHAVAPRGYRSLAHVSRLGDVLAEGIVGAFDGLDGIMRASLRDLEAVPGLEHERAREVREGLRRIQEHSLMGSASAPRVLD
jgi:diadenylate cyclase